VKTPRAVGLPASISAKFQPSRFVDSYAPSVRNDPQMSL